MLSLKIILASIAALLILIEQLRGEKKYRKLGLWLALLVLIFSIALTISEHFTSSKLERERKADLLYIQQLNSPVHRLGFDFSLVPIDTARTPELVMLIRMDIALTELARTTPFASLMNLHFIPNSGWNVSYNEFVHTPRGGTFIELDSSKTHFRLWLNDFSITLNGQVVWRPRDVADLGTLVMKLTIMPDNTKLIESQRPKRWNPVEQVDVYVNNLGKENLLFSASPYEFRNYWFVAFFPDILFPFIDSTKMEFRVNPLWMRSNILKSLD